MCGIAGCFGRTVSAEIAEKMGAQIAYRGPDDRGVWHENSVALAHRRLSIVELSAAGHQPMLSSNGRWAVVFNGEIYNHSELRRELSCAWRGHSDTETLVESFAAFGIEKTLEKCVGMFAIAAYDREARTLTLARDRFGEKPLYYGVFNQTLLFASELKAIVAHPDFRAEIDRNALAQYLKYGYIPAPHTIYKGVFKLPAASFAHFDTPTQAAAPKLYWDLRAVAAAEPLTLGAEEAADELERLLKLAVKSQMMSDVPLGAFLSGGIDSSTVVALAQSVSSQPVKTFTIGFHEEGYNEAVHAKAVAAHLGTDHTELYVTPKEAMGVIPQLAAMYDEPFADSSQIPTYLVSKLARSKVTVSLSGDAGDELFCGYQRYSDTVRIWRLINRIPLALRRSLTAMTQAVPIGALDLLSLFSKRLNGDRLHKIAPLLSATDPLQLYDHLLSAWKDPETVVIGAEKTERFACDLPISFENQMAFIDQNRYLQDDILVKVDRAAMSVSLESRVPMLDKNVAEFAWRLPLDLKIRSGKQKWLLRQVLYQYVPRELVERPKMGFGVPIDVWLRGGMREWAEDLLSPERLKRQGFLHPEQITKKWREHKSGARNWSYYLWSILMFQQWLD
ncbi:asparagine synthetase B [Campylobacterota bacterium]|nr:asparagine synthetase B [Campylobacterota bacterium]